MMCVILGVQPDVPTEINENGGRQSATPYAFHFLPPHLIHAGVDPKTVQYLAGHENSKITMDIYAKVKYNKPEQLLAVVDAAFTNGEAVATTSPAG